VALQNRVTPFGELIATEARGTLMGNRGCLHDDRRRIRRHFVGRRWISCVLEFKGWHRTVMTPHRYTELFFLDEATALAAGHRPCAECQRARYLDFRAHWAAANPDRARASPPSVDAIDRVLHAERIETGGAKRTYREGPGRLPPGAMVADDEARPYLVLKDALLPWMPGGYARPIPIPGGPLRVLTPRSIVRAITHGFAVAVHSSAAGASAVSAPATRGRSSAPR
jgi:hypothetical protein